MDVYMRFGGFWMVLSTRKWSKRSFEAKRTLLSWVGRFCGASST